MFKKRGFKGNFVKLMTQLLIIIMLFSIEYYLDSKLYANVCSGYLVYDYLSCFCFREGYVILEYESTPRGGGVNRCMANLMTNDAELKTNCNTLSVTKEWSRISGEGL